MNEINPANGLVKDRSTENSPASIAAMGFAVPIWAIGAEHNWITREEAVELTLAMVRFLKNSEQSAEPLSTGYRGLYYHFLDMETGKRIWECELSTIDSAWLLAGLRFASQYYNRNTEAEKEIRETVDYLTSRIEWDWTTTPDTAKYGGGISMSWHPEKGFERS